MIKLKKILITGGNGYIGSQLNKELYFRHEVTTLTRRDFDLTNSNELGKWFEGKHFDVVLHCASVGVDNPKSENWDILDENLKIYYNLLGHTDKFDLFINFGSGAELDKDLSQLPYGMSKFIIKQSILNRSNFFNIRIFGLFDENEGENRFIKSNLLRYINKQPMFIYDNKLMDFFYMQDFVRVVEYFIFEESKNKPKEVNCCYENVLSLKNITNIINNLDNYKVNIIVENQSRITYKSDVPLGLYLNFIGLEQGIKNVYKKLKEDEYKD